MAMLAPTYVGMQYGEVDSTMPLKVNLPSSFEPSSYMGGMSNLSVAQEQCFSVQLTSSQWSNLVNAMAPLLNAQGLRRALVILDSAMRNVERRKALDDMATQTAGGYMGAGHANYECATVCAMMQMQLHEQQQLLYQELQQLPFQEGIMKPTDQTEPAFLPPSPTLAPMAAPGLVPGLLPASTNAGAQPAGAQNGRRRAPQTLSTSLRILEAEDPDCLLIVRRISKLGFKATRSLKKYFSAYGPVVKVLLAHSTARQYSDQQFHVKRRPSNLGFIQMGSAEATKLILAKGINQEIEGVSVCVQRFERHDEVDEVEDTVEADDVLPKLNMGKLERGMSEASTAASCDMGPN